MEVDLSDVLSDVNQVNEYLKANTNIGEECILNDMFERLEAAALTGLETRDSIREIVQEQFIHELGLTKKEEKAVPKSGFLENATKPSTDLEEYAVKPATDILEKAMKPFTDLLENAVKPSIDLLDKALEPSIAKESVTKNKRKCDELILTRNSNTIDKKLKICQFASVSHFGDAQNTMMTKNQTAPIVKNDEKMVVTSNQMDRNVTEPPFQKKLNVAEVIWNDAFKPTTSKDTKFIGAIKENFNPNTRMDEAFIVISDDSGDEDDIAVVGMVGPINEGSSAIPHPCSSTTSVYTAVSSNTSCNGLASSSSSTASLDTAVSSNPSCSGLTSSSSSFIGVTEAVDDLTLKLKQIKENTNTAKGVTEAVDELALNLKQINPDTNTAKVSESSVKFKQIKVHTNAAKPSEASLKLEQFKYHKKAANFSEASLKLKQIKEKISKAQRIRNKNQNKFEDMKKKKFNEKKANLVQGESSSKSKISKKSRFNKIKKKN